MKAKLILICLVGTISCTVPKEARIIKKQTKEWRNSVVVLQAYLDSPFSGTFLILRENGKFEHTSSGVLKSFEAGNWTSNLDTIYLYYVDLEQKLKHEHKVIIDKKTSTLMFLGNIQPPMFRLRIWINKL